LTGAVWCLVTGVGLGCEMLTVVLIGIVAVVVVVVVDVGGADALGAKT